MREAETDNNETVTLKKFTLCSFHLSFKYISSVSMCCRAMVKLQFTVATQQWQHVPSVGDSG